MENRNLWDPSSRNELSPSELLIDINPNVPFPLSRDKAVEEPRPGTVAWLKLGFRLPIAQGQDRHQLRIKAVVDVFGDVGVARRGFGDHVVGAAAAAAR